MKIGKHEIKLNTLKGKITLIVTLSIFLIVNILIIYIGIANHKLVYSQGKATTEAYANTLSKQIEGQIQMALGVTRTIANTFQARRDTSNPLVLNREQAKSIVKNMLPLNPAFAGAFTLWEPNAFDNSDDYYVRDKKMGFYGRFTPYWLKLPDSEPFLRYLHGFDSLFYYKNIKLTCESEVIDPYINDFSGEKQIFCTVASPVTDKHKFIGLVGIDFNISFMQQLIEEANIYDGEAQIRIYSQGGVIAADFKNPDYVGKNLKEVYPAWEEDMQMLKEFTDSAFYDKTTNHLDVYKHINIELCKTQWMLSITVPDNIFSRKALYDLFMMVVLGNILLFGIIVFITIILRRMVRPITRIAQIANKVATGDLSNNLKVTSSSLEVQTVERAFISIVHGLKKIADFAAKIGEGKLETEFVPLSQKDLLGNALLHMRNNLRRTKQEDEKRKIEDNQRNWASHGVAMFGDILRQRVDNINELGYSIVSNLVTYVDAELGAIFLLNDDNHEDAYYSLLASHAYNRRRFIKKNIYPGEGLVGSCALEKSSIVLTEIPPDYLEITSGFGQAKPTGIIVTPIKSDDKILGVIELAAFHKFQAHEIEFIETIAEDISSTLASMIITERTNKLLRQFQEQSSALAEKEEQMQLNMEELISTQEESGRREAEMQSVITGLNTAYLIAEYDMAGNLLSMNDLFLEFFGKTADEMKGFNLIKDSKSDKYYAFWEAFRQGKGRQDVQHFTKKNIWINENYIPILDINGVPYKVMNIASDITYYKKVEAELERLKLKK